MNYKILITTTLLCALEATTLLPQTAYSQESATDRTVKERLTDFLKNYTTVQAHIGTPALDSLHLDHNRKLLDIYASPTFGYQPFTPENVEAIYRSIRQCLPGPVNYYDIRLYTDGRDISRLIPNALLHKSEREKSRLWGDIRHDREHPWVKRTSRPYTISRGLEGDHLAVWQSHGNYYKNQRDEWTWQRPRLWCTTEDLFTQSFVVPYIIPMLEKSGANVFTPRERDPQRFEVIVDNDQSSNGSIYYEEKSRRNPWKQSPLPGFAHRRSSYSDGEAPFVTGTARFAHTAGKKKNTRTLATWIPFIPETGAYAVYVSYQTLPGAVNDARYTVFHKGGATEFSVNQQMGGGTWVYLGTFEFDKGQNDYGFVALSNESGMQGIVSADAVRFGGGMGNIERAGKTSGKPRYIEGARYWAQWAGMPYDIYAGRKGENDYADDINTRSHMTNYLSGGSSYNPAQKGLKVPIEMTLGVHSDAGFSKEDELIGSLGIYTTDFNNGLLSGGLARHTSRDLCDLILTGLSRDLPAYTGAPWTRRAMWNRNYSESRLPAIPSMILETLSHQNFADMKLGHEPDFKFTLGRSVYKSILKFMATQHGREYTVQPLPVDHFSIRFTNQPKQTKKSKKQKGNATAQLSWTPVTDPLEPTARPTGYVVYTRIGHGGFDNGTYVNRPTYTATLEPGLVYSFRVAAVNEGGESFPSETLTAYQSPTSNSTLLIVNAFDRLSGPATIETSNEQGFLLNHDAGIPYMYNTSFCGAQQSFDRRYIGRETSEGLGFSGNELEGMKLAGNTFDYPFVHGKAIQATGNYSFVSCSDEAVEDGMVNLSHYPIVDLIMGQEKSEGHSAMNGETYQALNPAMQQALTAYLQRGGCLLASGSYIGCDPVAHTPAGASFISQTLKFHSGGSLAPLTTGGTNGTLFTTTISNGTLNFTIPRTLNEERLAVPAPEVLTPAGQAFAAFAYEDGNQCAAIAYPGTDYRTFIMGFPFESIREEQKRAQVMAMVLRFLSAQ